MASTDRPSQTPASAGEPLPTDPQALKRLVNSLSQQLRGAEARIKILEQDLKASLKAPSRMSPAERELKTLSETLERYDMLLERDHQVARELQTSMTPDIDLQQEGLGFAIETRPGKSVGGDFYDIIPLKHNCVAFLIADVSGYGLPAAVIMATGRLAFRTHAPNELNPRTIMESVNRALLRSTLAGHYLTAFLGVLDTELLTLQYVNASHCSPFLIRNGEVKPLDTEGLFVGMFEDPQYEQKGEQLEKNDRLFLYTDGLLRGGFEGKDRHEWQDQLLEFLKANSKMSVAELVAHLSGRLEALEDDVAMLGIELLVEKAQRKTIAISSIPREVAHVENAILPVLDNKGWGERAIFGVKLALEEAVINAIKHGNELDDTKKVTVSFSIDEDRIILSVADEGEGFRPEDVPDPTTEEQLMATSGRGLALIRAYMDEVPRWNDRGNEITLVKYAPWAVSKHS